MKATNSTETNVLMNYSEISLSPSGRGPGFPHFPWMNKPKGGEIWLKQKTVA
jgi:hypothetical protein